MRLVKTHQCSATISQIEKRMPTAMWAEPSFVACATWLETIAAASIISIQKAHKFCRAIPMVVRWSERMIRDIPSRAEDQKVHQRVVGYLRLRCQHAEDRRIDVIFRDAADIHKLLQRVFIGHITGVSQVSREKAWHSGKLEQRTFRARRRHRMACDLVCKRTAALQVCTSSVNCVPSAFF